MDNFSLPTQNAPAEKGSVIHRRTYPGMTEKMQNQEDYAESKASWERLKYEWQQAALQKLEQAEALLDEVAMLQALIELADDQIADGPG